MTDLSPQTVKFRSYLVNRRMRKHETITGVKLPFEAGEVDRINEAIRNLRIEFKVCYMCQIPKKFNEYRVMTSVDNLCGTCMEFFNFRRVQVEDFKVLSGIEITGLMYI